MMMLRRSRWTGVCWRTALRQHVSLVRTVLDSDERALCLSLYNPKGSERHAYRFRVQNWRARSLVSSQTGCDPTTRLLQPITAQNLRADSARSHTLPGDRVSVSVSPAVHSASWVCGPITATDRDRTRRGLRRGARAGHHAAHAERARRSDRDHPARGPSEALLERSTQAMLAPCRSKTSSPGTAARFQS